MCRGIIARVSRHPGDDYFARRVARVFQSFLMLISDQPRARCLVESALELADVAVAVVGEFARGVVVVDDHAQPRTGRRGRPLEHLEVAVRIAEGHDRPLADGLVDPDGLAFLVVDELDLRQAHDHGLAVADLVLRPDARSDDALGRNAVDVLGERAHELDAAARDDPGREPVGFEVVQQLTHRLVREFRVRALQRRMSRGPRPLANPLGEFFAGRVRVRDRDDFDERLQVALGRRSERRVRREGRVLCRHGLAPCPGQKRPGSRSAARTRACRRCRTLQPGPRARRSPCPWDRSRPGRTRRYATWPPRRSTMAGDRSPPGRGRPSMRPGRQRKRARTGAHGRKGHLHLQLLVRLEARMAPSHGS